MNVSRDVKQILIGSTAISCISALQNTDEEQNKFSTSLSLISRSWAGEKKNNLSPAASPEHCTSLLKAQVEPIQFTNRENPDLKDQLTFLIKREFYVRYAKLRKVPLYLAGITLAVIAIYVFTPTNSLITLKAITLVLLGLAWGISVLVSVFILIKWIKRNRWKNKMLEWASQNSNNYTFYFDQDVLKFEMETFKSEISWAHYIYWAENKNSIFIFPESNLYDSIYYSESELGTENYQELKRLASSKLINLGK